MSACPLHLAMRDLDRCCFTIIEKATGHYFTSQCVLLQLELPGNILSADFQERLQRFLKNYSHELPMLYGRVHYTCLHHQDDQGRWTVNIVLLVFFPNPDLSASQLSDLARDQWKDLGVPELDITTTYFRLHFNEQDPQKRLLHCMLLAYICALISYQRLVAGSDEGCASPTP